MVPKRKVYTADELEAAAVRVLSGEKAKAVSDVTGISYAVLSKNTKRLRQGETIVVIRRGPAPQLPDEVEACIVEWIFGMQAMGFPVEAGHVIAKATAISQRMFGCDLGRGWYQRFVQRHPQLATRHAQVVSRVRNEISTAVVQVLFMTLLKLVIEQRLTPDRIFNVDETAFMTRRKSRRVVTRKGSKNLWTKQASTNFHLSIVVCASASGFVLPPSFILPGQRVHHNVLDNATDGSTVMVTTSGFITTARFIKWLQRFAESVPASVPRPLVLVMDGCSSHFSVELLVAAMMSQVLVVCLPPNGTHLLQPLDVSCFSTVKKRIQELVRDYMISCGATNIPKDEAIRIGCEAIKNSNLCKNIVAGFATTGIYPLNRVAMATRLGLFSSNGTAERTALWLKHQPFIQGEALLLPCEQVPAKKRKYVEVGGQLLTRELLHARDKKEAYGKASNDQGSQAAEAKIARRAGGSSPESDCHKR